MSDTSSEAKPTLTPSDILVRDMLHDRKMQRRHSYIKFGLVVGVAVLYLSSVVVSLFTHPGSDSDQPGGYVALVRVEGEIGAGKEASAEGLNPMLEKAFADDQAKGVILRINSPGGTPVQSALINQRIRDLKARFPNKKVVAVGEDMVTSGAYMIAVAADQIVVNASTVTGSIGVITRGFGFTGLMDKLGIERRVATAGRSKNMLDPFGPQSAEELTKQGELLADIHQQFINTVRKGRGDRLHLDTPDLFSGTVWTGERAVEIGLADSLGDVDSVARDVFKTPNIHEYAPHRSLLASLISGVSVEAAEALRPQMSGPTLLPN